MVSFVRRWAAVSFIVVGVTLVLACRSDAARLPVGSALNEDPLQDFHPEPTSWAAPSSSFRYRRGAHGCINSAREPGYNVDLIGECGWLEKAQLEDRDFRGASFRGANLSQANFAGSLLQGADFSGANLQKANLFGGAQLQGAIYSADTRLPFSESMAKELGMVVRNFEQLDRDLRTAVYEKDWDRARLLLEQGADANGSARVVLGWKDHEAFVLGLRILAEYGLSLDDAALGVVIKSGDFWLLNVLLTEFNVRPNPNWAEDARARRVNSLRLAIETDRVDMAQALLQHGASARYVHFEYPGLEHCVGLLSFARSLKMVQLLASYGASAAPVECGWHHSLDRSIFEMKVIEPEAIEALHFMRANVNQLGPWQRLRPTIRPSVVPWSVYVLTQQTFYDDLPAPLLLKIIELADVRITLPSKSSFLTSLLGLLQCDYRSEGYNCNKPNEPENIKALSRFEFILKAVLAKGVSIDERDARGKTLLELFFDPPGKEYSSGYFFPALDILLSLSPNVKWVDALGNTLLHQVQDPRAIEKLIKAGAPYDEPNHEGRTPIMECKGRLDCIEAYVKAGARIDTRDRAGNSVAADVECSKDKLSYLVSKGWNVGWAVDSLGRDMAMKCSEPGYPGPQLQVVEWLLEQGVSPTNKDRYGRTLLHCLYALNSSPHAEDYAKEASRLIKKYYPSFPGFQFKSLSCGDVSSDERQDYVDVQFSNHGNNVFEWPGEKVIYRRPGSQSGWYSWDTVPQFVVSVVPQTNQFKVSVKSGAMTHFEFLTSDFVTGTEMQNAAGARSCQFYTDVKYPAISRGDRFFDCGGDGWLRLAPQGRSFGSLKDRRLGVQRQNLVPFSVGGAPIFESHQGFNFRWNQQNDPLGYTDWRLFISRKSLETAVPAGEKVEVLVYDEPTSSVTQEPFKRLICEMWSAPL